MDGPGAWTCCNKRLRDHLSQQPGLVKIRLPRSGEAAGPETHPPIAPTVSAVDATQTDPFSTESQDAGSSFLITTFEEK
jgi:hypothetical protein